MSSVNEINSMLHILSKSVDYSAKIKLLRGQHFNESI